MKNIKLHAIFFLLFTLVPSQYTNCAQGSTTITTSIFDGHTIERSSHAKRVPRLLELATQKIIANILLGKIPATEIKKFSAELQNKFLNLSPLTPEPITYSLAMAVLAGLITVDEIKQYKPDSLSSVQFLINNPAQLCQNIFYVELFFWPSANFLKARHPLIARRLLKCLQTKCNNRTINTLSSKNYQLMHPVRSFDNPSNQLMQFLIDLGIDFNTHDQYCSPLVGRAALNDHNALVQKLIAFGADPLLAFNRSALDSVISKKNTELIITLLPYYFTNTISNERSTLTKLDHTQRLRSLFKKIAPILYQLDQDFKNQLIELAIKKGKLQNVILLLQNNINSTDKQILSILLTAYETLVEINEQSYSVSRPEQLATLIQLLKKKTLQIAQLLISKGALDRLTDSEKENLEQQAQKAYLPKLARLINNYKQSKNGE